MLPYAKKANILIFIINHITRKVDTGFVKSARDLVGLGESESLPGGRAAVYLANNVLRYKNKKTLTPDKDFGINGHIISAMFLKSRTNASQIEVELIFDKSKGFSTILSMLHYADINGLLKGTSKKTIPMPEVENISFTRKTFLDVARQNPQLITSLYDLVHPHMRELLGKGQDFDFNESDEQRLAAYNNIMSNLGI